MSLSKPLSYEPLKTVLAYIEASKRFEISRTMQTIRKTEKMVPLKIGKLAISSIHLTVNQTVHNVSVVENKAHEQEPVCRRLSWSPENFCLIRDGIVTEYVKCNKKQYEHAPIYLMNSFFGGRSDPILVRHFSFNSFQILKFPLNAKFQIQHLTIQNGIRRALRKLSRVLTNSSFPLQSLEIFVNYSTGEEFRDEIVQKARKVIVCESYLTYTIGKENWNFLPANTYFEDTHLLRPDNFVDLIRHWKVSGAAPGRRCSVGLRNNETDEQFGIETILRIQEQFDVVEENRVITIPINQSSEVHVSVRDYDEPQNIDCSPTSMLLLEVVAKK